MPKPRVPATKADISGAVVINPGRFTKRREPPAQALGPPPHWMSKAQAAVWQMFVDEVPWLNGSHRAVLEIASVIRCRLVSGDDVGVQALNLLRQCLGQMGATPADATKVSVPNEGEDDPDEKFFSPRPH